MKKVLFVVEAMGGGVFTYIVDLANELSKYYDVYVAYGLRKQTPHNFKNYFNKKVHLVRVSNFTRSINPIKDIQALNEIKKISKKIKPDIIHLHSSKAGVLGRICFFNFKKGTLFYTPHGYSFLMKNIGKTKRKFYLEIEKIFSNLSGITIACSPGEYKMAKKITNNATYVSNGINVEKFKKVLQTIEKRNSNFTVTTLGRISLQKGPKTFNQIAQELPEISFKWIGDGELKDELTASNIQITGWLNRKEALEELMSSDVFILSSLWEGLPISLLEAMFLGKVCIVSNVVGNNDVINDGKNGFISRDKEDYVNTIKQIYNHEIDIKKIEKNAINDVLTKYNTKVMARKYISIYEGKIKL